MAPALALGCVLVIGGCQASPPPASTEPITHKTVAHPGDAAVSAVGSRSSRLQERVLCGQCGDCGAGGRNCSFKREPLRFGGPTRPGRRHRQIAGRRPAQPLSDSVGEPRTGGIDRPGSVANAATSRSTRTVSGYHACATGSRTSPAPARHLAWSCAAHCNRCRGCSYLTALCCVQRLSLGHTLRSRPA